MAKDYSMSLKVIGIGGAAVLVFLWLASMGLQRSFKPDETQRVADRAARSDFDKERAMALAVRLYEGGPDAIAETLTKSWRSSGLEVRHVAGGVSATYAGRPQGGVALVAARHEGDRAGGAIADAAPTALLAEIARVFKPLPVGKAPSFLWLDSAADAAEALRQLAPGAIVVLEGVGDCYLRVSADPDAPDWMRDRLLDTAESLGYRQHFSRSGPPPKDALGIRGEYSNTLYLADPILGGSLTEHARLTQPGNDTPAALCPNSLQAVGDVLYHAIPAWEGGMDGQ
ncbi:MAG: hypothetical protein GC168_21385 [Candidatus Hydrogenedens sp.]|nr:hypothetical protein [Candidatus Hydrogenedens sp.]